MIKQYLKQAFYMLKENRLVSIISIAGTAISIAMIMVVILSREQSKFLRVQPTKLLPISGFPHPLRVTRLTS